ncbi:MAG: hypothetical protein QN122_10760 [Armatimonadota bacterium]|nr:hypothetical protein [Armatimonadota bacterium]MDR7448637.1 hypothetical protein [Armatimonadota bacterium]MDR7459379.1 hypothetical protein [Armatimonadota bacterium]MDR7478572.1 hypothetical protein [Armatimonadota bacterium]MDR7491915.1 hypothetical protein [Armatimonadota bacterium]
MHLPARASAVRRARLAVRPLTCPPVEVPAAPTGTLRRLTGLLLGAGAFFLFILAIELLKTGARGLTGILQGLSVHGVANVLGFGWVISMVTTATIYLPAMALGALALRAGWLDGVRFGSPVLLASVIDLLFDPLTASARAQLPGLAVFALGFATMLGAFRLFDRVLPEVRSDIVEQRWGRWLARPFTTFALGLLVTSVTLSVSVSLSLLVPLAARGYIRRGHVIPYIMGANISTFVDTPFASLLVRTPVAFTIVLTEMVSVALVSLAVLVLGFRPYRDALLAFNKRVTTSRLRFSLFVATLALVPLALLLL